ncbi:MAG: adenosylhomocysteinase [Theionarchaea archaeon]|nr:adenosylhomocysteinase [Theionarchaea archaeon]MBU7020803.1 adenosylhomocysteinase [Theionarchaea archaeon]MBU7034801.1 adenosylhomocysteinase [Theionarchaea archaeon]MBU7040286.1 adenosylhomocysteinase [Theionarchaea archaeon]
MDYAVREESLAPQGKLKIEWADRQMPVINLIRQQFERDLPLKGMTIAACLHVTSETANLMRTLKAGGAVVALCASNPLSTQDDVAASLVKDYDIPVFAVRGEDGKTYYEHLHQVLDFKPTITMDDGGDLVSTLHTDRIELRERVKAGTEETTTGIVRFRNMEREGALKYPIIAVNDAQTKHFFDNRYGTGQSSLDGILRATNVLLAGKKFVVAGYGWCGRGVAMRARGMGSNVVVTEVDPLKALEATMDGFSVMPMKEAARIGDIFITATGDKNVIREEHMMVMKDGTILCNTGHFDVEVEKPALEKLARERRVVRENLEEYVLKDGRSLYLLGEGRLVNLACAEGHPSIVMDMSFANQALSAQFIVEKGHTLEPRVYQVPPEIDNRIAALKLKSMNVEIDVLTPEQDAYLSSWKAGT